MQICSKMFTENDSVERIVERRGQERAGRRRAGGFGGHGAGWVGRHTELRCLKTELLRATPTAPRHWLLVNSNRTPCDQSQIKGPALTVRDVAERPLRSHEWQRGRRLCMCECVCVCSWVCVCVCVERVIWMCYCKVWGRKEGWRTYSAWQRLCWPVGWRNIFPSLIQPERQSGTFSPAER